VNIVDLTLFILLLLFALRGYFKGLFREGFSLLGFVIGLMVAVHYDEPVAAFWIRHWNYSFIVLRAITFVALFFFIYFAFSLTGWFLHRSAKFFSLHVVNRVGGIALGLGKGAAVLALAIFFLASFPLMPEKTKERIDAAYLGPPLYQLAESLIRIGKAKLFPEEASGETEGKARSSQEEPG